jgi:HlyD family secretion protein
VEVEAYNNRKFKGVVTQIASSTKTSSANTTSGDVTNYEVRIRIDSSSYSDLVDPSKPKKFPFRPGMNASARIKTKRKYNVISVPIAAVAARLKGSDKTVADEKKEKEKARDGNTDEVTISADELEEVVFVIKPDGTVEKRMVTTGIQDMNYIEIINGLKEGEQIVTAPFDAVNKTMKSGDKVTIVPKDKLFQK